MKKITAIFVCLATCSLLLFGCGTKPQEEIPTEIENDAAVLGTWSESYFDSGYTFNADGTGRDTFWDLSFTYTAYDGVITITYDDNSYGIDRYTYSVSESELTMTRQSDSGKSFTYSKN